MRGIEAHRGAPKLTEDVLARLCAEIERGMPVETACRLVEVWPSALQQRMAADPELAERIERARARAQKEMLVEHRQLAREGERTGGHEFLLSRLWPKQFAPPVKAVEQSVTVKAPPPDDTPEQIAEDALALLTEEQRAELLRKLGGGA